MSNLVNPNVLLGNTIVLIKGLVSLESDPTLVVKLKRIAEQAKTVKKTNLKTYKGHTGIKKFKQTQNIAINRRAIKALSETHTSGGSLHRHKKKSVHFSSSLKSEKVQTFGNLARKVLISTLYSIYITKYNSTIKRIQTIFGKNHAKAFLESRALLPKSDDVMRFVNICMLSGLSLQTDVEARLDAKNPKLIRDLIENIQLTNEDLPNLELLTSILLAGHTHASNPRLISVENFDSMISTFLGFYSPVIGFEIFDIKNNLDIIVDRPYLHGHRKILGLIRDSLDRFFEKYSTTMGVVDDQKYNFLSEFINSCEATLRQSS